MKKLKSNSQYKLVSKYDGRLQSNLSTHKSLLNLNDESGRHSKRESPNRLNFPSELQPPGQIKRGDRYTSYSSNAINRETKRPVSLANMSSNCYLNSGLQALSSCWYFVSELKQLQSEHSELEKLRLFSQLIQILFYGHKTYLELPRHPVFRNWNKTGQQDCFELLTFIINEVFDEIKKKTKKNKSSDNWLEAKLPMRITFEYEINCCPKGIRSRHRQCDLALHIPFPKSNGLDLEIFELEYLLDENFIPEIIEDYKCSQRLCNGSGAKKTMRLCQPLPSTICIHLQRLMWVNGKMQKNNDTVKFSEEITIKKSYCVGAAVDEKYVLRSVIIHSGDASFGHYICYKLFNDIWFHTDDSSIREADLKTVLNCQAYILFYEHKRGSPKNQSLTNHSSSVVQDLNVGIFDNTLSEASKRNNKLVDDYSFSKEYGSNVTSVCDFESDTFKCANAVISALSVCPNFIDKLTEYLNETDISKKYRKLIKCVIGNSVPLSEGIPGITDNNASNIFQTFENIMNAIYENDVAKNDQGRSERNILSRKCPLEIINEINKESFGHLDDIYNRTEYAFGLNWNKSLQYSFEDIFEKKLIEEKKFSENMRHCTYQFIKLKEPLPETICFQVLCDFNMYVKRNDHVILKTSFLSNKNSYYSVESTNFMVKRSNLNGIENMDHKYVLKSIVTKESSQCKCFKWIDNKLFEMVDLEWKHLYQYIVLLHRNDILFFEKELPNITNRSSISPLPSDSVLSKSHIHINKEEIISNQLEVPYISTLLKSQSKYGGSQPVGNSFYLKIILCAVSNCSKLVEQMNRLTSKQMKKSYLFLQQIFLILKTFDNCEMPCLSDNTAEQLGVEYHTNLFQFILTLFKNIDQEWSSVQLTNPLKLNTIITTYCGLCKRSYDRYEDCFTINIPVDTSEDMNIQHSLDQIFKKQSLDGFQCKNNCLSNEDEIITKFCYPYPQVIIIHVGNVIWNGNTNKIFDNRVTFEDTLHIDIKNAQYHFRSLNYELKSIISYVFHQYRCYVKRDGTWCQLTENGISVLNVNEWNQNCPNIMFYQLYDT